MFTVTEQAKRPASLKNACFYCNQAIGQEHKSECVFRQRKAKIRVTIEYMIDIPAHWDEDMVNFHRNESSWCASNIIEELQQREPEEGCLCPRTVTECIEIYPREFLKEE